MTIAAEHLDVVVGVDTHIVMVPTPAGPVPTPLPQPFVGIVFDEFDPRNRGDGLYQRDDACPGGHGRQGGAAAHADRGADVRAAASDQRGGGVHGQPDGLGGRRRHESQALMML
ncbi:MAG: hypothetical protein OXU20_05170 [Myxococcales bacterium]|nr:hypothetical protein [Myxococcales bacterium]